MASWMGYLGKFLTHSWSLQYHLGSSRTTTALQDGCRQVHHLASLSSLHEVGGALRQPRKAYREVFHVILWGDILIRKLEVLLDKRPTIPYPQVCVFPVWFGIVFCSVFDGGMKHFLGIGLKCLLWMNACLILIIATDFYEHVSELPCNFSWLTTAAVSNLWVVNPKRPSENIDICATIHNSSKMTVRK